MASVFSCEVKSNATFSLFYDANELIITFLFRYTKGFHSSNAHYVESLLHATLHCHQDCWQRFEGRLTSVSF